MENGCVVVASAADEEEARLAAVMGDLMTPDSAARCDDKAGGNSGDAVTGKRAGVDEDKDERDEDDGSSAEVGTGIWPSDA